VLRETALATTRITAGMMFILICAQVFALSFRGLHGEQLVADLFRVVPGGVDGVLIFMMLLIFILGFFIEWIEISYIVVPLFLPLLLNLNVDLVWVASLIALNCNIVFDTTLRLGTILPARCRGSGGADACHLQGRCAFHRVAAFGPRRTLPVPEPCRLVAARHRLVGANNGRRRRMSPRNY
jgi:hypothetical protein